MEDVIHWGSLDDDTFYGMLALLGVCLLFALGASIGADDPNKDKD